MPYLRTCLPNFPQEDLPELQLRTKMGRRINAATVGDAIAIMESLLRVRLVLHPEEKYFRIEETPEADRPFVGIGINRGAEQIREIYDMTLPLLDTDTVIVSCLAG